MKKAITILTVIISITFLASVSLAENVYTDDQLRTLLEKQCESVILLDEVYQDYSFSRALTKADCTNYKYKSNLFDCDDIAYSIKALVVEHISEITDSGGAVMFGVAFVRGKKEEDSGHIVNIAIYKENVWIYDWQVATDKNITKIEEYLKTHIICLIMI